MKETFWKFPLIILGRVGNTAFYVFRGKISKKFFVQNLFQFPSLSRKMNWKFSILSENLWAGLPQLLSPDEHFQWFSSDEKQLFSLFCTLIKKTTVWHSKCPQELFEEIYFLRIQFYSYFLVSKGIMRRRFSVKKMFLWIFDSQWKFIGLFAEFFGKYTKIAFCVHRIIVKKILFSKIVFIIVRL